MGKNTTFFGVSKANAKRIVDYEFGDCLIKIQVNDKTQTYEVHIIDTIEKKIVEKFKEYWKHNFKIRVYTFKYEL